MVSSSVLWFERVVKSLFITTGTSRSDFRRPIDRIIAVWNRSHFTQRLI